MKDRFATPMTATGRAAATLEPPASWGTTRLSAETIAEGTRYLQSADARLAAIIDAVGPCTMRPRGQIYRSLFRSILYQQLAGNAAAAIERRVHACCGGSVPTPADFLRVHPQRLRRAGLSRQKLSYLRDLAATFDAGRLRPQQLAQLSDAEIVAAVTTVRGIGEWTAHMMLIFSLGRPDVLPVGDYGVRKGMQHVYKLRDLPVTPTMERIATPWRPYRSIASWYLWRSLDGA
jgi:DNA-3-methyladenine glycosylase II